MTVIAAVAEAFRTYEPGWFRVARRLHGSSVEVFSLLAGAVIWEGLGRLFELPWLPPFSSVVAALANQVQRGLILGNLLGSLRGLAIGFGLSLVIGLVLGALMGLYPPVEQALDVFVHALLVSPNIIFAPIFFALFGVSNVTQIAVIFLFAVFVIIINTCTAIQQVDRAVVEMAVSFGATPGRVFWRVIVPASLPVVFAGIRLGVGRAVKGMINGEMYVAVVGLGALVERYGAQFNASNVLAVLVVVGLVGLLGNWIVNALDRRWTSWAGA